MTTTNKIAKEIATMDQISQLIKTMESKAHERVARALNCGAIDESSDLMNINSIQLAKAILFSMRHEFDANNPKLKKEFNNLSNFL